jgi:hypothetical protein
MSLTGTLTNYPTVSKSIPFTVTINSCVLTSASVASTAFGFTQTVTIFGSGFSFAIATYTQTPACGYIPVLEFLADTVPSTSYASQPFYL